MSQGEACRVHPGRHDDHVVTVRRANYSAFNGYHYTPSDYSQVRCLSTAAVWRTKAGYVDQLRDMNERVALDLIAARIR